MLTSDFNYVAFDKNKLHVGKNKSHVNIIMFHVVIIYFACRGQKYASTYLHIRCKYIYCIWTYSKQVETFGN